MGNIGKIDIIRMYFYSKDAKMEGQSQKEEQRKSYGTWQSKKKVCAHGRLKN